jgi:hypothetical protein
MLLPMNTLIDTIKELGDEQAAARWGLTPRAVAAYRRGERRPNHHVVEMIRLQEGWTYDQIFSGLPPLPDPPDLTETPAAHAA